MLVLTRICDNSQTKRSVMYIFSSVASFVYSGGATLNIVPRPQCKSVKNLEIKIVLTWIFSSDYSSLVPRVSKTAQFSPYLYAGLVSVPTQAEDLLTCCPHTVQIIEKKKNRKEFTLIEDPAAYNLNW